jgi:hypothetical protein
VEATELCENINKNTTLTITITVSLPAIHKRVLPDKIISGF